MDLEVAPLSDESALAARHKSQGRSRASNNVRVLPGADGRSAVARRFRDIVTDLTEELGGNLSTVEQCQLRAAASLQVHVETLMAQMARGEVVSPEEVTRAGNSAVRALDAIRRRKSARRQTKRTIHDVLANRIAAE